MPELDADKAKSLNELQTASMNIRQGLCLVLFFGVIIFLFLYMGSVITNHYSSRHKYKLHNKQDTKQRSNKFIPFVNRHSPQLEVLDGLYPFDRAVERSVRAGVTCACVCPGSDGVIGGVA